MDRIGWRRWTSSQQPDAVRHEREIQKENEVFFSLAPVQDKMSLSLTVRVVYCSEHYVTPSEKSVGMV